ncbi:MAG: translation initiation factor IF-2 [Synergistaceae bacterium]|jgi:translation initiation factor IF-2|nr:translation initiation factor IF-2 [Synergistaceae bacterium]
MNKIRIYELSKLLGLTNPELLAALSALDIKVKSHSSSLDMETAQLVEDHVNKTKNGGRPHEIDSAAEKTGKKSDSAVVLHVGENATVGDIAKKLGRPPAELVRMLIGKGFMIPANTVPSEDAITVINAAFNREIKMDGEIAEEEPPADEPPPEPEPKSEPEPEPEERRREDAEKTEGKKSVPARKALIPDAPDAKPRPPIVTVLGHVDHGKTTLLDFIRKTRVTEGEAGGITQHIGAYKVEYNGNRIVFLDTPGHEAFTSMRARGASVTDIAVLVVAAEDGVMPQTLEAVNHAKAAGVPIIVAINKVDKPDAKPERVRQQLSDHGLVPEEWGGDVIMVEISAKTGHGVDNLLDMVLLVAEMGELKASESVAATGVVVEANLDKGKGPVASVIVQQGTLRRGNIVATDTSWGKIRAMLDDEGRPTAAAGPGSPIEVLGFETVPMPGETFRLIVSEREAKDLAAVASRREVSGQGRGSMTLEELYSRMQTGDTPRLNVILKCDVQGSLEAFHSTLMKMSSDAVRINIIHEGVGRISGSDVDLAAVSRAVIIGFNVRPDANAKKLSEAENVQIRLYRVIYDMQEDIKSALEGMLAPTLRENTVGTAEIRNIFKIPKAGRIAGCFVRDGAIKRSAKIRVVRDGIVLWDGSLSSLRHFKDDVREISAGNECGLNFAGFQDFREGDIVEAYEMLSEKQTLDI